MHPVLFRIAGHAVLTWPVLALVGAWAAWFTLSPRLARRGIPAWQAAVFFLGCVAVWFAGAWLGQTLTVGRAPRAPEAPLRISGFVLYGGVLLTLAFGAVFWALTGLRRRLAARELWDLGALTLAWALFFGRIGCALYGCCYGTPSGPWPGYALDEGHWDFENRAFPEELRGVALHPAPLYEAAGIGLILIFLLRAEKRESERPGTFPPAVRGWLCWMGYALVRFLVECIRLDPRGAGWWGLSPSQCVALATLAIGAIMLPWEWRRRHSV